MLAGVPHLLVHLHELLLSLLLATLGGLVEHVPIEGVIDVLSLGVGHFGGPSHFQEDDLDGCHEDDEELVEIIVRVVVEEEVEEEVLGKVGQDELAGRH